jgi:hypothetical protein
LPAEDIRDLKCCKVGIVFLDGMRLALDRRQERTMYDERTEDRSVERPASRDTRLTYDDFVLFPDDGMRHEIIDGEHYVTPSPNPRHQMLIPSAITSCLAAPGGWLFPTRRRVVTRTE